VGNTWQQFSPALLFSCSLICQSANAELHMQSHGSLMPVSEVSAPSEASETDNSELKQHKHDSFATQADIFSHGQEAGNIRTNDNVIEIYGTVFMSVAQTFDHYTTLTSTGSRLGFRGHKLLRDNLLAFWQIESIVDLDNLGEAEHGGNRSRLAGRDSFVGISNNFGTIVAGKHNLPYKMAVHSWDPFNHLAGDFRTTLGRLPGFTTDIDHHGNIFHLRAPNALLYYPPVFSGVTTSFALRAIDESINNGARHPIISASIHYSYKRLNITYAVESHSKLDIYEHATELDPSLTAPYLIDRSTAHITGFMAHLGNTMISAIVEGIEIQDPVAPSGLKWSWHIGAIHKLESSYSMRASLGHSGDFMDHDGGSVIALGLFNSLSEETDMYFSYVQTINNAHGRYGTFFSDAIEDSPESVHNEDNIPLDRFNPYTLSIGLIHQF